MTVESQRMTAQQLLGLPRDGCRHELIEGELRTMPPAGWEHGDVATALGSPFRTYVQAHQLGQVVIGDVGFQLARNPDTVRAPDVAFVRRERLEAAGRVRGYWPGAPDLVVEVISPNDLYTDVEDKIAEWLPTALDSSSSATRGGIQWPCIVRQSQCASWARRMCWAARTLCPAGA
jgi:Uma2 family endonuclease